MALNNVICFSDVISVISTGRVWSTDIDEFVFNTPP